MTTRPMDRRALFASAAAAAFLTASGVSAASQPKRGGRLRMALSGALRSDTWTRGDGLFMQVARQGVVFDTLTEVAADGTLKSELAVGWTSSADARDWVFDLRRDVTFHDGVPFTAADVIASAQGFNGGIVAAVGLHQVAFHLTAPDPSLPLLLAQPQFFIQPAHAMDSGVGTGLYQVTSFTPGQHLRAARVVDHYKGDQSGWFDEVELTSIPADTVRAEALGSYLVDATDLTEGGALQGNSDVTFLPDSQQITAAVSRDVAQPARISADRPLDNLRAAERWWFA